MALPKRSTEWRQITVDGTIYRWRLDSDETKGWLTVRLNESGSPSHKIDLPGISDPWINVSDREKVVCPSITPKIVATAILRFSSKTSST